MSEEDSITVTVELTRGTSTDDRDKIKAKVSAPTVSELESRVEQVRDRMEEWAENLRDVQPTTSTTIADDQSELGELEA